jgi:hypothetical protein
MIQSMQAHQQLARIQVAEGHRSCIRGVTCGYSEAGRGEKQNSGMWQSHCILVKKAIKVHKIET